MKFYRLVKFNDEPVLGRLTEKNKKHYISFGEICESISIKVLKRNQKYYKNNYKNLMKIIWITLLLK